MKQISDIFTVHFTELTYRVSTLSCMNPSILFIDGYLHINVRLVNYKLDSSGKYTVSGKKICHDNPVRTENIRTSLSQAQLQNLPNLYALTTSAISNMAHVAPTYRSSCVGLEDCRLFAFKSSIWFCATSRSIAPQGGNVMCIGHDQHFVRLIPPLPQPNEKNWLPFQHGDDLFCIYSHHPFTILHINIGTGLCKEHIKTSYPTNMSNFRGSTCPVRFDETSFIYIVHEVFSHFTSPRNYVHRFIWLSHDLEITHISKPIKLGRENIEYVCGLSIVDDIAYISFGVNDNRAMLASCGKNDLLSLRS